MAENTIRRRAAHRLRPEVFVGVTFALALSLVACSTRSPAAHESVASDIESGTATTTDHREPSPPDRSARSSTIDGYELVGATEALRLAKETVVLAFASEEDPGSAPLLYLVPEQQLPSRTEPTSRFAWALEAVGDAPPGTMTGFEGGVRLLSLSVDADRLNLDLDGTSPGLRSESHVRGVIALRQLSALTRLYFPAVSDLCVLFDGVPTTPEEGGPTFFHDSSGCPIPVDVVQ